MPQIFVVSRPWPALVTVRLVVPGGALSDPAGQEGLAALGWTAALHGAGSRTRDQFNRALDGLGTHLAVSVDKSATTLVGDVGLEHVETLVELMADTLLRPRLEPAEVEAVREDMVADLAHLQDDDEGLAMDALTRYLYRGTPLGRPSGGSPASLAALRGADLRGWHRRQLAASGIRIGFAGAIDRARAEALVAKYLSDLPQAASQKQAPIRAENSGRRLLLIDKPRRAQTQVMMALATVAPDHKDMLPLLVANAILGGAFTSRLTREIRELRGWSYGTWSTLSGAPGVGTWSLGFAPATRDAVPALDLATQIVEELQQSGVTPAELEFAKDFLIGAHRLSLESADRELGQRMRAAELGLPDDEVDTFAARVRALDYRTVQRALGEHLRHAHLTAVLVGSARNLLKSLDTSAAGFAVEQLPADALPEGTAGTGRTPVERPPPAADLASDPSAVDDGEGGMEEEPDEP